MSSEPSHYEVLALPEGLCNEPIIPAQTLRSAYRRALLQNHPDKSKSSSKTPLKPDSNTFSIDQISEAFNILSNHQLRLKYDRELKLQNHTRKKAGVEGRENFHTGVETLDLDDLEEDEVQGIWYKSCRCGDDRGFLIGERDLEEAADDGELNVACRGCSLWLKVLFGVIEDEVKDATIGGSTPLG
ncbi:diphthamide biosynthesis protein-like protein 4 [Halenospora varia]|nr:diphthamide biosynthesis protein-like protein 4 [Halenospora varia]